MMKIWTIAADVPVSVFQRAVDEHCPTWPKPAVEPGTSTQAQVSAGTGDEPPAWMKDLKRAHPAYRADIYSISEDV